MYGDKCENYCEKSSEFWKNRETHALAYTHTHSHTHTYARIHTHTHTHTHTFTYTQRNTHAHRHSHIKHTLTCTLILKIHKMVYTQWKRCTQTITQTCTLTTKPQQHTTQT